MKRELKMLMVDDHPVIIEAYRNILASNRIADNYDFKIDTAFNCDEAIEKINQAAKNTHYEILFLDIQLPPSADGSIISGEDLAVYARKLLPKSKILILTTFNDNHRIQNILKTAQPDALLIKDDLTSKELLKALNAIVHGDTYYSITVTKNIKKKSVNIDEAILDDINRKIIFFLSKGIKTKDLTNHINLSLSAIEKRKGQIRNIFELEKSSDEEILKEAKKRGFIE